METCKKIVFVLSVCCILMGCGDYDSATNRNSHGRHYSDLISERGEPREVVGDGSGGKIFSWSPLPIDEALQDDSHNMGRDVYRVNHQGYVYP